jgi:tetratricopeptide (TPR) repeat protein
MLSFLHSALVAALLLISLQFISGDDTKAPAIRPELAAADQLYRAGKFAEAEASYQSLLNTDSKLVSAQVGLVRAMLRQQKVDEAFDAVNAALAVQSNSAALLAAKGDVQFRRAEMSDAELSYLAAKKLDHKEVHAYLGLAQVYSSYSLYRTAYGELQIAHEIAPDDIEVQRAWLGMLPRKEKLAALEAYLGTPHPDNEEETRRMTEYLEFLKATADKPVHACRLVSKVEQTETKLETMEADDGRRRRGISMPRRIGLSVKLNNQNVSLLLDTGAGGIIVSRTVAENAGLTRLSALHFGGIGDRGLQSGYTAVADHIRIGELEFQDCVVDVISQASLAVGDGLIGANVFGDYLVDIDFPGMWLKLSPLPKHPEDIVPPTSLNSEGEEQANAEQRDQKESSATERTPKEQRSSPQDSQTTPRLPRDRYIAPEMNSWTKVFRFGHAILVPTSVNDSKPMLFELDTGAFSNILSLRAARQVAKVGSDYRDRVKGVSGEVRQVYSSKKATLSFGRFRQSNLGIITFDLSNVSSQTGTEVSGFLGFEMLERLELKLDYRDGLVDFAYDPKRVPLAR